MEEKILQQLKTQLTESISRNPDKLFGKGDKSSSVYRDYSLSSQQGKQVYESFSDEELLNYLQNLTKELGYVPAQKEVFWILKEYIKTRFGKWPYALRAAGLPASAGKGGRSLEQIEKENKQKAVLLRKVQEKAMELGKIPHPKDLPEIVEELRRFYDGWTAVIDAAGLDEVFFRKTVYKIPNLESEYRIMLAAVKDYAYEIGRAPLHGEIDDTVKKALIGRCGSWRNALYQIGLEPVMRMHPFQDIYINHRQSENRAQHTTSLYGCYYKVLNLNADDRKRLAALQAIIREKNAFPEKKDVPEELRKPLQEKCGSWGNVLYQLGISPKTYFAEKRKEKK